MRPFVSPRAPLSLCVYAIALILFTGLAFSSPAFAGSTINVPADQPTIQSGINAAVNGDTVLVAAGTYYENINFNGKAITVTSASGPAVTIIDGSTNFGPIVTFSTSETSKSILSGFTLRYGYTQEIYIQGATPTIQNNVVLGGGTTNYSFTTGIWIQSGGGIIQNNLIVNSGSNNINASGDSGLQVFGNIVAFSGQTGVEIDSSNGKDVVQQNVLMGNDGPGLNVYYPGPLNTTIVVQNLITGNHNVGLTWAGSAPILNVISNTIAANQPPCCGNSTSELSGFPIDGSTLQNNLIVSDGDWTAVDCTSSAGPKSFTNNDVFSAGGSAYSSQCPDQTGTNANLSVDPLFSDLLSNNFHLQSGSPVIKAGTISASNEPKVDFDGDPRVVNGSIDIGADEYTSSPAQFVSTYSLHFGSQDVSTTSAPQTVTLTNNGKVAIPIKMIATGPSFSQTNNCGTRLAVGSSCQISVTFSPLVGGPISTVLGIFTSATVNPEAVTLLGTGLAPQISISCCFYFYNEIIYTSTTETETVTNTGTAPLLISSIAYSGSTDFVESNDCPISPNSLAVGASCTITVIDTPTIVGNDSGTITITSNVPQQSIYVNGSSFSAGNPVLNPNTLTFPTTLIGQSSAPQTATLTNMGTTALGIYSIYSYGDFQQTNDCPASLAVNASCTITATFTPSVEGSESSYIYIGADNSYGITFLYTNGTGQAPLPTVSSLSQASAPAGSTDTPITITGTGFVPYYSQVFWNGVQLNNCCIYFNGTTQMTVTIPAANLATAGTAQISVFTPAPGGGTSNSLPFTIYTPTNYSYKSTTYSYHSISGTNLNMGAYTAAQITSPFPIQFGGGSYNVLTVSSSGTISFNGFANYYPDVIPTALTPMLIAPFWQSLYPFGYGTDNNVFWAVTGTAPNRELTVEWRDVGICCETTNTVRFEVVFFEGNSNVLFNYADTLFGGSYSNNDNGALASIGIQGGPNLGVQYSYFQPSLASKTAWLYYPSSPNVTLSTSSLNFGYHQTGTASLPQSFTLTNGGLAALSISSIAISNPDFSQTNNCGTSLASNQSCQITVKFKPSQPTTETTTVTITDSGTNSPQTVSLTGIGTVTSTVVYPILVNFGSIAVGSTGTAPVTLANASNAALTIQKIATTPSVYTEANNCGTSLAAGQSCTVTVTFTPTQPGSVQGTLSMALNGKASKVQANLTGSGK